MKYLIYSDVHGNLPAFEKMLEIERECDSYICLGDLVNYGPWSNECVDLALSLPNTTIIIGNHEQYFIEGVYPGTNDLVVKFFEATFNDFSRIEQIRNFIESTSLDDFICTHTINNSYIYPDTHIELDRNYLIGHSHHQFEYHFKEYTLINAGSVGQNRKNINVIDYVLYDSIKKKFVLKNLVYDSGVVIQKMKNSGYPQACIEYYLSKVK